MSKAGEQAPAGAASAGDDRLCDPQVRLAGEVNGDMLKAFLHGMAQADGPGPLVVELTTTGGDADIGRRIAADVRLFRERTGRRAIFFGKAVVYSAGVSIMSAFPRDDRWLAAGTMLLIHDRSLKKTLKLDGPLRVERTRVEMVLAEIDAGLRLQEEGFQDLIAGSDVDISELRLRASSNWYLDADEALARRLIAGVI